MTLPPTDDELLALYRHSDAARAEPSPVLDRAIVDAARQAAATHRAQPAGRRARPWWQVWLAPVSVAAVAVVGLTLSVHIAEDPDFDVRPDRRDSLPNTLPVEAPSAAPAATRAAEVDSPMARRPPAGSAGAGGMGRSDAAAAASSALADSAGRSRESIPARMPMKKETGAEALSSRPAPAAFPPLPAPPSASSPVTPALPIAAGALADRAKPLAPAAANSLREERQGEFDQIERALPLAPVTPQRLRQGDAAANVETRESYGAAAKSVVPAGVEAEAKALSPDPVAPERWLAEIQRLRASGQATEAARELERFRQRYPDYPLPRELANPAGR